MHDAPTPYLSEAYAEEEFFSDLLRVSGTRPTRPWPGVRSANPPRARRGWASAARGFRRRSRARCTWDARTCSSSAAARRCSTPTTRARLASGIDVAYDAEVVGLDLADGALRRRCASAWATRRRPCGPGAVVVASGGFEANLDWLREVWGDAVDGFVVRGTPYNRGTVLRMLLDAGAQSVGDATACHAVAVDARAPTLRRRHRDAPRLHPVRHRGQRARPALLRRGRGLLAEALRRVGRAWWRASLDRPPSCWSTRRPPARSCRRCIRRSWRRLDRGACERAPAAGRRASRRRSPQFNAAVRPGTVDYAALDDCRTAGLTPEKTHWAQPLDTPPYWAYPLRPGITFTYLGLRVWTRSAAS